MGYYYYKLVASVSIKIFRDNAPGYCVKLKATCLRHPLSQFIVVNIFD